MPLLYHFGLQSTLFLYKKAILCLEDGFIYFPVSGVYPVISE
jgi:hypothetical protein